ncbi:hypothetical protein B9Z55_026816 [Caenorhabditis nigoni]|uniref:CUB-like domain-containing protein n=1 Tax=Caenorhabditis nigoni TaxID=1611254 RepID=A0A2G5SI35_9PELO|nr:hypothetical protein B9Z55_026816 [Caenorhabditis nigoni]
MYINVEKGGNLYLASNDDRAKLSGMTIISGSSSVTLDQLNDFKSFKLLSNQLTIHSNLDLAVGANLKGYLYATTAIQADDETFDVRVVNGPQVLTRNSDSSTTVILNTQFLNASPYYDPDKTTLVTGIRQFRKTPINFHYGIPGFDWQYKTSNQFFENPQPIELFDDQGTLQENMIFFESVEPMQINLPYWYITADGSFSLNMDSTSNNENIHKTNSTNTTGVFILNDIWMDQYVNFVTDSTRKGYSGVLVNVDLTDGACITFNNAVNGGADFQRCFDANNKIVHGQFSTNVIPKSLLITHKNYKPGTLYCQYFVYRLKLKQPLLP